MRSCLFVIIYRFCGCVKNLHNFAEIQDFVEENLENAGGETDAVDGAGDDLNNSTGSDNADDLGSADSSADESGQANAESSDGADTPTDSLERLKNYISH